MLLGRLHMRVALSSQPCLTHVCCGNKQQLRPSRHWLQGIRCAAQPEESVSKQRQPHATVPRQPLETNVWAYKPVWCQPWSILGTGCGIVAAVRWVSHESLLFTFVAAAPVALWWWLFLLVMPQQFEEAVLQQNDSMQ